MGSMEIETVDLTPLDVLFQGTIDHLTGGPGVGKSFQVFSSSIAPALPF